MEHALLAVVAERRMLEVDGPALRRLRRVRLGDGREGEERAERLLRLRRVAQELTRSPKLHQRCGEPEPEEEAREHIDRGGSAVRDEPDRGGQQPGEHDDRRGEQFHNREEDSRLTGPLTDEPRVLPRRITIAAMAAPTCPNRLTTAMPCTNSTVAPDRACVAWSYCTYFSPLPHHQRVQEEDQHERHERRKRHPPVHNEEIDQAEKRHRDRGQDVLDRVRDKLVQRYNVTSTSLRTEPELRRSNQPSGSRCRWRTILRRNECCNSASAK